MLAYGLDSESSLPIHLVATPPPHAAILVWAIVATCPKATAKAQRKNQTFDTHSFINLILNTPNIDLA